MTSSSAQPAVQALTLSNGYKMPQLGIGTARTPDGEDTCNAIVWALQAGYRHIDTAAMYKNEVGVGQGVRKAISELGLRREEIFVTTKVWNDRHGYDETLKAFEESMEKLDIGYVDLYLIHWPRGDSFIAQDGKKYLESWRALEKIYADGRAKAIGVANFEIKHLQDVLAQCTVKPMVNQVELHPLNQQVELRKFCDEHNIKITCWSPIGQGKLLDDATIATIAAAHKRTPAQVILRWELQLGLITIPKSTHKERIIENAKIFDFELTEEEVKAINGMNKDQRYGPIPSEATF